MFLSPADVGHVGRHDGHELHVGVEREVGHVEDGVGDVEFTVLADAQTSGGMLISVPQERSEALVKSLVANQTLYSSVIGKVFDGDPGIVTIWQ